MNPKDYFSKWKIYICPHCLAEYELGVNGTLNGCDKCEGIERDANGHIIVKKNGITSIRRTS